MAKQKLDPTQYKWFEYDEQAKELTFEEDRHNEEYMLVLHPGNVFGVKKRAHGIFVVHKNSPDIQFTLREDELTRIMQHSRGWTGKIKRVEVKPGVGDLDKPQDKLPPGWTRITDLNSSNINHAIYDIKRKVLYVAFHRGDSWAYENVSKKEYQEMVDAESRGRFFYYRIRNVKPQYQLGKNFDKPPYDTKAIGPTKIPGETQPAVDKAPVPKTKSSKAKPFAIPDGMKVNGRAKITITHSAHPGKTTTKTWSGVGFEWLGSKNPELPRLLGELATNGKAEYTDEKGTAYLTLHDKILVPDEPEKPRSSKVRVRDVSGTTEAPAKPTKPKKK